MKNKNRIREFILIMLIPILAFNGCKKEKTSSSDGSRSSSAIGATLITLPITGISLDSANSGGNITSDGGANITTYGVCFNLTGNPTILDNKTIQTNVIGLIPFSFQSQLTGLAPNTTYFVRAYATNSLGTTYGNQQSFSTFTVPAIGIPYRGGVIAYILQPGDYGYIAGQYHGFIAAFNDQGWYTKWGCQGTNIYCSTDIGKGNQNTNSIVSACNIAGIPARICYDLVLNGYNDWYLPSKDELNQLYINRVVIGGFVSHEYWSSSGHNSQDVFAQIFDTNGSQVLSDKDWALAGYVRAIRSF